jgi:GTP-binding protein
VRVRFVDEVTVFAKGGRGGDGSASIRREPFTPRGGPDGGDGGRGGNVVFEVSSEVRDLSALADNPHLKAEAGRSGGRSRRSGARGRDLVLAVPDGTRVEEGGDLVADLVGEGVRAVVARGGRGGRGNTALAGRRDRVPRWAEAGEHGEERRLRVELRTVADLGLVGLPNAGKSTLLAKLTAATPKIADYPFTTLSPNLGVSTGDSRATVADVPGLVEGAHEGRGLGHRFLRHVARCRALVLVVDLSADDPTADLRTVRRELELADANLAERPWIAVGTKGDLVRDPVAEARRLGDDAIAVSAVTGEGLQMLELRLAELVQATPPEPERPMVTLRPARPPFVVRREGDRYRVVGRGVERWVHEADLEDPSDVAALQRRLLAEGVEHELVAAGARRGDEVVIGDQAFEFIPEGERDVAD